jgi:hypothetical protein
MNHKSYIEYFSDLKKVFIENANKFGEDPGEEYYKILFNRLLEKVKSHWRAYSSCQLDNYMLSDEDIDTILKESKDEYIGDTLIRLSEKGFVKMSIGSDGEMLYSISEDGREYLANLK